MIRPTKQHTYDFVLSPPAIESHFIYYPFWSVGIFMSEAHMY